MEIAEDELDNLLDRGAERAHQVAAQTVENGPRTAWA